MFFKLQIDELAFSQLSVAKVLAYAIHALQVARTTGNFNNYSNFDFIVKRNELLSKISEIKNFYLNAPTNTKYQN